MSHGDKVTSLPDGYETVAVSDNSPIAAFENSEKKYFGLQFHPEVTHTKKGLEIIDNFIKECDVERRWTEEDILKTIAEPKNRPCVFHCASGKDRTGLVAMFLMASAGCTREDIIHEYNKSEDWGISHTHAELIGAGGDGPNKYVDLDTKKNLASPRWAMEATLDYLDKNYNGIEGYLDSIGFTKEWRAKLN